MSHEMNSTEELLQPAEYVPITKGQRLILKARKLWFNVRRIIPGFVRYHFLPQKSACLILCPMRSGSTLLKALLAEAEDVSSLPEVSTLSYRRCHPYAVYDHIAGLAPERIIVIKRPGTLWIPFAAKFLRLKIIILSRDLAATSASIEKVTGDLSNTFPKAWEREGAVDYWCDVYENIFQNRGLHEHDIYMCKYEELLTDPVKETEKLFEFLGSSRKKGTKSYSPPSGYEWQWGTDDASDNIKSLSVQRTGLPESEDVPPGWEQYYASPRVVEIRQELGYQH